MLIRVEINDKQITQIREELSRMDTKGANGKEEDYGTWEAVGKWHGIKFVLDTLNMKI